MIGHIFIKNFKMYEKTTIKIYENNLFIGDNDSGKSTILEALDIFFNYDRIPDINLVRDISNDVEIGIFINGEFFKKTYSGKTKKVSNLTNNFDNFPDISYVFLKANYADPSKLIADLSVAKTIENTPDKITNEILDVMIKSGNDVLSTIDPELIVVNKESTELKSEPDFRYSNALKFNIQTERGIPLEGRGSGFKKNITYSLLTKGTYTQTILGIDEIENSLSLENASVLLEKLSSKFLQSLVTTHSNKIMEVSQNFSIIPRFTDHVKPLKDLLLSLDSTGNSYFMLVEGKYDIPWIKKALEYLDYTQHFIIIPSGGDNINILNESLMESNKKTIVIKDGDKQDEEFSLNKDVIEMYCPIDFLNSVFNTSVSELPDNKVDFFNLFINQSRNEDSVKEILSQKCNEFLQEDNLLIDELKEIINKQI